MATSSAPWNAGPAAHGRRFLGRSAALCSQEAASAWPIDDGRPGCHRTSRDDAGKASLLSDLRPSWNALSVGPRSEEVFALSSEFTIPEPAASAARRPHRHCLPPPRGKFRACTQSQAPEFGPSAKLARPTAPMFRVGGLLFWPRLCSVVISGVWDDFRLPHFALSVDGKFSRCSRRSDLNRLEICQPQTAPPVAKL